MIENVTSQTFLGFFRSFDFAYVFWEILVKIYLSQDELNPINSITL